MNVRKTAIATGQISMPPCTCTFPFCPRSEHTIARPRSCQCPFARCTCGVHPNFKDPNHCSSTRTAAPAATTTAGATSGFGLGSSATTATATAATATSTSAPAVSVGLTTTTRLVQCQVYSIIFTCKNNWLKRVIDFFHKNGGAHAQPSPPATTALP